MKSITTKKFCFNFNLTKITPFIALIFLISCTPEWEERGFASEKEQIRAEAVGFVFHHTYSKALALGIPDYRTYDAFIRSEFIDMNDVENRDNADQFMAATEAGFDVKEDYIKAKKSNIETKKDLLTAVQAGGFYNIDNYFKAKELGISSQEELTNYEYDEVIVTGLRSAGKRYRNTYRCQDVSWRLTGSLRAQRKSKEVLIFSRFESFFRDENSFLAIDIELSKLKGEKRRVFFNSVGPGTDRTAGGAQALFGTVPRGSNSEKSYFVKNCRQLAKTTCTNALLRDKLLKSAPPEKSNITSRLIRDCKFFVQQGQLGNFTN